MRRSHHRFRPTAIDGPLEERRLLHAGAVPAAVHALDRPSDPRHDLPIQLSVNELLANFQAYSILATNYVNVLFNFSGSYPSPGASGATSTNSDGTFLLTGDYNQTIASITSAFDQAVLSNVTAAAVRPGTDSVISARIDGNTPDSLVAQLSAIPVNSLAGQGPSSTAARTAALVPISQAVSSAQSDVIAALRNGARPGAHFAHFSRIR